MKVSSQLVKMNFIIGKIERKGDYLIIVSDDEKSTIPAKVRLDIEDVLSFIKKGFNLPVLGYLFAMPFLLIKAKKSKGKKG